MKVADMHCDTVSLMLEERRKGRRTALLENELHLDLKRMKQADYVLQNFAMFVWLENAESPYEECMAEYSLFKEEMEKNSDLISQVFSYADIEKNRESGKLSALLTIEEGEVCEGKLSGLKEFYELGVRMMTLTWNYDNSLSTSAAHSKSLKPRNYAGSRAGLTEKGIEFVQCMEELGMIPDVSHMSDEGICDMLEVTEKPFVASHSNARTLCTHPRNLTDEFIRRMAEKGCVIGANFYSRFLEKDMDLTRTERIAEHILYLADKGGIECVGLGTDFDGITCDLEMNDCAGIQTLADALIRRGMSESDVERVFYKNVLRLYRELL